ncbi:hypothetical protein WJX72_002553 [[Myrmecia] bisecta]|uniref:Uncharacterized protein n=1 Tax=[Myrmecia] bisecta TaxID=41462 RepID=A0AAW1QPG0_9CHLO
MPAVSTRPARARSSKAQHSVRYRRNPLSAASRSDAASCAHLWQALPGVYGRQFAQHSEAPHSTAPAPCIASYAFADGHGIAVHAGGFRAVTWNPQKPHNWAGIRSIPAIVPATTPAGHGPERVRMHHCPSKQLWCLLHGREQ